MAKFFAAVDSDDVVWGLGETEEKAKEDAGTWIADCDALILLIDLDVHEVNAVQVAAIKGGNVDWYSVKVLAS